MGRGHESKGRQTVRRTQNTNRLGLLGKERREHVPREAKAQPGRVGQTEIIRKAVLAIPEFDHRGKANGTGEPHDGRPANGGAIVAHVEIGPIFLHGFEPLLPKEWTVPQVSRDLRRRKADEGGNHGKRVLFRAVQTHLCSAVFVRASTCNCAAVHVVPSSSTSVRDRRRKKEKDLTVSSIFQFATQLS